MAIAGTKIQHADDLLRHELIHDLIAIAPAAQRVPALKVAGSVG